MAHSLTPISPWNFFVSQRPDYWWRDLFGGVTLAFAVANVILQLANPAVAAAVTTSSAPGALEAWPSNGEEWRHAWLQGLARASMEPSTVRFCERLLHLEFVPICVPWSWRRGYARLTLGALPPAVRGLLGATWTPEDEAWFARRSSWLRIVHHVLPGPLRRLPWILALYDERVRLRRGHAFAR
jgi:uncharacterized protein (DUF2236 family)